MCACGQTAGAEKNQCNPSHIHHRGNDIADQLADQGRCKAYNEDQALDGREECYLLSWKGQPCLGSIPETLKLANRNKRLEDMASSEVTRDKGLASMINLSIPNIRHTISQLKSKISSRFSIT